MSSVLDLLEEIVDEGEAAEIEFLDGSTLFVEVDRASEILELIDLAGSKARSEFSKEAQLSLHDFETTLETLSETIDTERTIGDFL